MNNVIVVLGPLVVWLTILTVGILMIQNSNRDEQDGQCRSKQWAKGVGIASVVMFAIVVILGISSVVMMKK